MDYIHFTPDITAWQSLKEPAGAVIDMLETKGCTPTDIIHILSLALAVTAAHIDARNPGQYESLPHAAELEIRGWISFLKNNHQPF